jgi:hypothetical protein
MRCSKRKCIDQLHTSMSFRTVCQYPADMQVLWRAHNQAPAGIVKRQYQTITGLLIMSIFWKTYSMPKWPDHPLTADLLFLNFLNPEYSSFWIIWDNTVGCIRCIMPPYVLSVQFCRSAFWPTLIYICSLESYHISEDCATCMTKYHLIRIS